MYQAAVAGNWQTSPLVVDGVMYLTQRPNDVVALDAKTGRVFWIYRHTLDADADRLLRREQSRPRDPRRHVVHGHARCAPRRHRREVRSSAVDHESRREQGGLLADAGAAGRQGQGHRRRRRRRVRHSRLHRRLRRAHRQGSVALLHDSRPRRGRIRDVGRVSADHRDVLRSGGVEARRRVDLGHRIVRSRRST